MLRQTKNLRFLGHIYNEVIEMVDLTTRTIKRLFEQQIRELTSRTVHKEDSFDYQFGGWVR